MDTIERVELLCNNAFVIVLSNSWNPNKPLGPRGHAIGGRRHGAAHDVFKTFSCFICIGRNAVLYVRVSLHICKMNNFKHGQWGHPQNCTNTNNYHYKLGKIRRTVGLMITADMMQYLQLHHEGWMRIGKKHFFIGFHFPCLSTTYLSW